MTPTLRELQSRFKAAILTGDPAAVACFVRKDALPPEARLNIHRNQFRASLATALADNYPVTCRLVGRDFFDAMARQYIEVEPPDEPCLSAYGATFPDFVARFEPAQALPYLPDVARLEWLRIEVTHAPEECVLDLQALAALPEEAQRCLPFRLVPRVRLFASLYPIDRIWLANQETDVPAVDLNEGGCRLIVAGNAEGCRFERLDAGAFEFFARAARHDTLAQAAENAALINPTFDLVQALALHRARGILADTIGSTAAAD